MKSELDGTHGYKIRDTADLKERTVERTLTFKLTEDDFSQKGKLAGNLSAELRKLESEEASVKKEWKEKLAEKEGDLYSVLSTIRKGAEDRVVKCIEQRDFNGHMVHYIFNGEVLHSRAMELHERQLEIVKPPQAPERAPDPTVQ